ncbi:hypothetical protein TNCV_1609291 [Trichonephila clavipes]|nr:hypothetical protein TNCV_1609291 [Trichonephila clavipes]
MERSTRFGHIICIQQSWCRDWSHLDYREMQTRMKIDGGTSFPIGHSPSLDVIKEERKSFLFPSSSSLVKLPFTGRRCELW